MESTRQHKLFWGSSYDRGLHFMLFMWPDVKAKFPEAELHIAYGWKLFDQFNKNNPERMAWKKSVESMMRQDGIVHHGRVGKEELTKIREECGIWVYPTDFPEINCITALEAQMAGCVPVTMDSFALKETVGSGIKVQGDIKDIKVQEIFLQGLLGLMGNKDRWESESARAWEFAKDYTWDKIAKKWIDVFKKPITKPSVSVVTLTVREGFWNVMAENLSKQTYKFDEWVIVDDYKEDRSEIAKKYAKKYNLNINYVRGDRALGVYKKRYGLSRANNIGSKVAKGDLIVFVQDFILIPTNGIESLVDLYRHNPKALLAPVDQYWFPKHINKENKEDWFGGDTDIIGNFSWRNVRLQFSGIRETENPFDFEMNYAGVPKAIIEHLNGWYEMFDEGIGYDNTEFSQRCLELGYKIIIDDTNVAWGLEIGDQRTETNDDVWEKFNKGNYPAVRVE